MAEEKDQTVTIRLKSVTLQKSSIKVESC